MGLSIFEQLYLSTQEENDQLINTFWFIKEPIEEEEEKSLVHSSLRIPEGFVPSFLTYTKKVDLQGETLTDVFEKTKVSTVLPLVYLKHSTKGTFFAKVHRPAVMPRRFVDVKNNKGLCCVLLSYCARFSGFCYLS